MDLSEEVRAYADADFSEVNARFVARAVELAGEGERLDVLDLGCGPGDIPAALARCRPGWQVVGVDASEPMLEVARRRAIGLDNLRFARVDAKELSSDLGTFDLITSNSLLHHLPDTAEFWRSLPSVARPGTVLFLRDLMRPGSEAAAREIVRVNAGGESALLQEEFYRSLLAAFTVDEIREQLEVAGLHSLRVAAVTDRHLDVWGTLHA